MKRTTWIANCAATLILIATAVFLISLANAPVRTQWVLGFGLSGLIVLCWFLWQRRECGEESLRWWLCTAAFGVIWSFAGVWIGSVIYGVSYLRLLQFVPDAWDGLGYMGPLLIGPLLVCIGLVSIVRKVLLDALASRRRSR